MEAVGSAGVQSVDRALRIVGFLAEAGGADLSVTEIGRRLGVHKTTASRLAATLARHGFIQRGSASDHYRLGMRLVHLATSAVADFEPVQVARPALRDLASETEETVTLGVLSGDRVVYVDQIMGRRSIVSVSWLGSSTGTHCSASGKVLLAWLDEAELDAILPARLERLTPKTTVSHRELRRQLEEIRARGYGYTVEELEVGLTAVAAPVRRATGRVVAALAVSGPTFRLRQQDVPRMGELVREAARRASREMGFLERPAHARG